jgi:hypothetical protein
MSQIHLVSRYNFDVVVSYLRNEKVALVRGKSPTRAFRAVASCRRDYFESSVFVLVYVAEYKC